MRLHTLNRQQPNQPRDDQSRSPTILHAIDTLNAVWCGAFDVPDTAEALYRTARELKRLADAIYQDVESTPPDCESY